MQHQTEHPVGIYRLGLSAAVSACADLQFETNSHRICEVQALGNSLIVGLRTGYSSVHTAGQTLTEGASYKWTYLLQGSQYILVVKFKDFSRTFKDQFSTEVYSMDSIAAIFNISFCDYRTVLVDKNKT